MNATFNHNLDSMLAEARAIRLALIHGAISYSDAKKKVEPLLKKANRLNKEIAKKYGRKYRRINFTDL